MAGNPSPRPVTPPNETDGSPPTEEKRPESPTDPPLVKPEPTRPVNPVEPSKKPLDKMTENEIKEKLAEYRTWVHEGQVEIELEMSSLSASDVARLVCFYVMRTDVTRLRLDLNGGTSELKEVPKGQLIADLANVEQWPPGTSAKSRIWFGEGIVDVNVAIVLNKTAELHLYRVLVEGLNGKHPEPGSTVVVAIDPQNKTLVFAVVEVSSAIKKERSNT